jgi:uncharacterized iron-regulated membrane protein
MMLRAALVRLHRWAGLAMAAFLVVAGLTGSVIAFNHELDEWLNPELFEVASRGEAIPAFELAARVEREDPRAKVTYFPLAAEPGHSLMVSVTGRLDPATGKPRDIGYSQVFFDPVTGQRLGERHWGAVRLDRAHLIPFLYLLHYSLHLPERWGVWLMGVIAIAWLLDCFVGFALTLPARGGQGDARPFWRRWKPSWLVKRGAGPVRFNFDLHRAAGLWLWGLLAIVALSAVYLNLQFEVFRPVISRITAISLHPIELAAARKRAAGTEPGVGFADVVARARRIGEERGWAAPFDVFYSQEFGAYGVGFGDHHAPGLGVPWVFFDDGDGRVLGETVPGAGTAGDRFMQWMLPLHTGQIIGLPGRIVVCILGIAVAMLSITGVVIWARKRRSQLREERRAGVIAVTSDG